MRVLLPLTLVGMLLLAGCSSEGDDTNAPPLNVSPDKGGIRGLVVDQSITPLAGATVELSGGPDAGKTATSGPNGLFNFTDLAPGDYFVSASKAGYKGSQLSTTVVAGQAEPPIVKVLLERLTTAAPYLDHFKLDGYYDCAYGIVFQTDACDWAYRTVWDEYNHSAPPPAPKPLPAPRTVQTSINTQYIDITEDSWTIIQEAFWDHDTVTRMMISLDETPIDNACDCSPSYMNVVMESPTYSRLELLTEEGTTQAPAGTTAAARGFIPFADIDPTTSQVATNLQFVIITSVFHNYVPAEGWTFETRANFPIE